MQRTHEADTLRIVSFILRHMRLFASSRSERSCHVERETPDGRPATLRRHAEARPWATVTAFEASREVERCRKWHSKDYKNS